MPIVASSCELIVEDGTGLSDANSYVSLAFAENYFFCLGKSDEFTGTDGEKSAKLITATIWLDGSYKWRGSIAQPLVPQALAWPREGKGCAG